MVPPKMHRKYYIIISYKTKKPGMVKSINQLNSNLIGSLIILKGIVVRADEVKPRISVATFTCDVCGNENYM
jgi:DNA replication licensing factor MCM7